VTATFSALPDPLLYNQTSRFSHLIDGYRVSDDLGWPILRAWANERGAEAARDGIWRGTALELWCVLFYERRRYRHAGEGDPAGAISSCSTSSALPYVRSCRR
jgi:hypothetical protein